MFRFVFILFFLAPIINLTLLPGVPPSRKSLKFALFKELTFSSRIFNGIPAQIGQFPYQVGLYLYEFSGTSLCGGSLISPTWVLTAAHCTEGVLAINIYLGTISLLDPNRVTSSANRVVIHPFWSFTTAANDLALIQLTTSVALGGNVDVINLGSYTMEAGTTAVVTGWGKTTGNSSEGVSATLNYATVTIISNFECTNFYGNYVQSGNMCAVGHPLESACGGDSGGPLTIIANNQSFQVGIVSFGSAAGCDKGYPTAYTRISAYRNWIRANSGV